MTLLEGVSRAYS